MLLKKAEDLNGSKQEKNPNGISVEGGAHSIRVKNNQIESSDLFVATREILIRHGDDTYRLRLTAQNKLILTK
jgi:hemin uptake protein HemP